MFTLAKQNALLKKENLPVRRPLSTGEIMSVRDLTPLVSRFRSPLELKEKQLIFVFTTTCKFCKANVSQWQQLASAAKQRNVKVFGISRDSMSKTAAYVNDNSIRYNVFVPNDIKQFGEANRLPGVPLTIVREPTGTVEGIWVGTLDDKQTKEVLHKISF
ncbi:MAG: redoxin domain-containing protein [Ignavibacteriales bacterium]|nr:redoxin domain-containing protein [Ignavibacteriales bacterium]